VKILILVRALSAGGAERQVALLAKGLRAAGHDVKVAVFYGGGALEADLENADVPLIDLRKRGRWDTLGFLWRLVRLVRRERPEAVYSFLTGANLLSALLSPLFPKTRMVWSLRASDMDLARYDWLVRLTGRIEVRLARFARLVIANSHAGRNHALRNGYPEAKLRVVPNGIDLRRFRPDREAGSRVRREWGIGPGQKLVGLVGRLDPMKGHPDFLRAAALLRERRPEVRFACVGDGTGAYRESLRSLAGQLGLDGSLFWAGTRTDMPEVYNALDIAVSASVYGEGLPNTLAEAMASGVPCVTTPVGDSAWVVGDTGRVVPAGDPAALAEGLEAMLGRLDGDGPALSRAARRRVEENLGVEALVKGTLAAIGGLS
jgi:glycosyltransferase involved in cell wall biosynthesis